jgi:transitional endoplasmic reticulum ATPase
VATPAQSVSVRTSGEMAKKKTKKTPISDNSPGKVGHRIGEELVDVNVPFADFLELRLSPQSKSTKGVPRIWLADEDARRMDVLQEEDVLLLVQDNGDISGAAICSAKIASNKEMTDTSNKFSSPSTPKSSRYYSGSFQVTPASLAEQLCGRVQPTVDIPQEPTARTPTQTSATPSKVFSFARGGGGDALISPRTQTPPTPSRIPSRLAFTIPLHTTLGKTLADIICQRAAGLELITAADIPPESTQILRRLILANYDGRFLCEGGSLSVTYQGKQLQLQVAAIQAGAEASDLVGALESLSINHLDSRASAIVEALQRSNFNKRLSLFRVDQGTDVILRRIDDRMPVHSTIATKQFVAGLGTIIDQLKEFLLPPLINPGIYGNLKSPRGVLLHGPSGVGKSAIAEEISSLFACQHKIHVELIHCTVLQSHTSIVGDAERRLTKLFHQSRDTLLILDDVHLICPRRGGGNAGVDRLAATLLSLLDGITQEQTANMVVLATTSNPSQLDPALRRPGRLDAEVEVPIPDEITRKDILAFLLANMDTEIQVPELSDEVLMSLSRLAKGFNGADCKLAIKDAVRNASKTTPKESTGIVLTLHQLKASIRAAKPSTISSVTVEIPQVYWTSIGGMESVKDKLREAIELPITHSHLFEALHIPPPRGVLLYGPPGCSKTLMARALATEGQMNFLAVKGPELLSKWLGESERALASLFRRARMASPCIIFFDEVDAIASKRGGGAGSAGGERLLSQLLTELDGINSPGSKVGGAKAARVIVVGATNRPDLLDTALTRPGRIDRMIYVGLPDAKSRKGIFEIGLKGKACREKIDVRYPPTRPFVFEISALSLIHSYSSVFCHQFCMLASERVSGGFSGAELISICREAALLAIEEDDENPSETSSPAIGMQHLMRAVAEMQRQVTPEMLDFYANYAKASTTQ